MVPIAELWEERRFLLDVARRMLGDPDAAERVVDETYRRWYGLSGAARRQIAAPRSWLAKTVGGICLGLPEYGQPSDAGEQAGLAVLTERARRWRQLERSRATTPQRHDGVVRAVCRACVTEDGELLTSLLCPDVMAFFDGGGRTRAPTGPVHGARPVADSLLALLPRHPHTTLATHSVNGRTGLVARYGHQVAAVIGLDVTNDRVAQFWVMLNPDKLRSWNRPRSDGGTGSAVSATSPGSPPHRRSSPG